MLNQQIPAELDNETLRNHLAIWIELALGLDDGMELNAKSPSLLKKLFKNSLKIVVLPTYRSLRSLKSSYPRQFSEKLRGGSGDGSFLAFKLHRFISGAGEMYVTLTNYPRTVLFGDNCMIPGPWQPNLFLNLPKL